MESSKNENHNKVNLPIIEDTKEGKEKLFNFEPHHDENIFKIVPCTIIIGQTVSGKTLLLMNLLC